MSHIGSSERNLSQVSFKLLDASKERKVVCDTKVFSQVRARKLLQVKVQLLRLSFSTWAKENLSQIVSQSGTQCMSRKSWWREEIERCCGKSRAVGRLPSLGDSCCSVASQEQDSETIPALGQLSRHRTITMTIMTA